MNKLIIVAQNIIEYKFYKKQYSITAKEFFLEEIFSVEMSVYFSILIFEFLI